MRIARIVMFCLTLATAAARPLSADGTLLSWSPTMTEQAWETASKRTASEILALNRSLTTWPEAIEALLGTQNQSESEELRRGLVDQINNNDTTVLTETSRLVIWERVLTGEILFEGKGLQVDDDLFSVGGRANWLLRIATQRNFGHIKPATTTEERNSLQEKWRSFLNGASPAEYETPYRSEEPGLTEIRSPVAIEALIFSLGSNPEKDSVTQTCLRQLYGLEELPESPEAPARLCSPDTYALNYLSQITEVQEIRSAGWWSQWWKDHHAHLTWEPSRAKFVVELDDGANAEPPSN